MRLLSFLLILALVLLTVHSATAYSGYGQPGNNAYRLSFSQFHNYYGSSSYRSPFYGRYESGNIGSHMYVRNKLDYQVWRNPQLLRPTYYTNNQRYFRGFNDGYFRLYHTGGFTGRIRR